MHNQICAPSPQKGDSPRFARGKRGLSPFLWMGRYRRFGVYAGNGSVSGSTRTAVVSFSG